MLSENKERKIQMSPDTFFVILFLQTRSDIKTRTENLVLFSLHTHKPIKPGLESQSLL